MRLQDGTSQVSEAAGARWRSHARIMVESSLFWQKQFRDFSLKSWIQNFVAGAVLGECEGWFYLLIGNDVSYVTRITDDIPFAWQAQYLVKWQGDSCCSAHCKWRFTGEADQSWDSCCVAGAVFGEVGMWLFVAGAAFCKTLDDSRSAKCCIFCHTKCVSKMGRVRSPKRRVRGDDFLFGLSWDYPGIVFMKPWIFRWNLELRISWQAQYLVSLKGDFTCSAHCKCCFICDADQSWDSCCVAGALFGWLLLLRAL